MTTPTIPTDEEITERTATFLRGCERHKGGVITPCDDWLHDDAVDAHAAVCATCRMEATNHG